MLQDNAKVIHLLRCPRTELSLRLDSGHLITADGSTSYQLTPSGIPLFAEHFCSKDASIQQDHYDRVAAAYAANLEYPHTQEYMAYLDAALLSVVSESALGTVAELCCGQGEAFKLLGQRIQQGIGVDISVSMLERARAANSAYSWFVQGDATQLPLASASFDSVFMLGGIHHVRHRQALFSEVRRILKPGGMFYYREPVDDFFLWRSLRWLIYRVSPALDHETERPLRYEETVPMLEAVGLESVHWSTHGLLGFCLLMNSDVLVINRQFRFIPGIRKFTRWFAQFDENLLRYSSMRRAGLQVVGAARRS